LLQFPASGDGDYFKRALQRNGQSAQVLLELATIQERRQNLAEAAELIGQALTIDGINANALLVQARIERGLGHLEPAEKIIRQNLQLGGVEPEARAYAWYELGGILDWQKRFDEAMAAFLEAKNLLRPAAEKFLEKLSRNQARLGELQEPDICNAGSRRAPGCSRRIPSPSWAGIRVRERHYWNRCLMPIRESFRRKRR
jgi:tetratricopeptide (TPR) repeat protein